MTLEPVPPWHVPAVWPRVEGWIAAGCRVSGDLAPDDLRTLCGVGKALLILIWSGSAPVAAGVTQVREYPRHRSCWILALGGARDGFAWPDTMQAIEAGARRTGCDRVEFVGRRGWARFYPDFACEVVGRLANYTKML